MGMRIHKVLGYGIKDLKYRNRIPTDPRWNYDTHQTKWEEDSQADLISWITANKELVVSMAMEENLRIWGVFASEDLQKVVEHNTQWLHLNPCGPRKTLIIRDPRHPAWYRWDNDLDYYEALPSLKEKTQVIRTRGIYPYTNMVRFRDPTAEVREQFACNMLSRKACQVATQDRNDVKFLHEDDYALAIKGPATPLQSHLLNDWRPAISPTTLAAMAFWGTFDLDIHNPTSMRNTMRPMIYTYWA